MPRAGNPSITYILEHDYRDLVVNFDKSSRKLARNILKLPPHPSFVDALTSGHRKFSPHISDDQCPWIIHRDVSDAYLSEIRKAIQDKYKVKCPEDKRGKAARNAWVRRLKNSVANCKSSKDFKTLYMELKTLEKELEEVENISLDDKFDKILADKGVRFENWSPAWYWKALFKALPKISEEKLEQKNGTVRNGRSIVRVSKIRQWVLVLVYFEESVRDKTASHQAPKRILLRPPLFGQGDRFISWDQYFSLCDLEFQIRVRKAWDDLSEIEDVHRLHEEQWYVFGRHDMSYTFSLPTDYKTSNKGATLKVKVAIDINLEPFHSQDWEIEKRRKDFQLGNREKYKARRTPLGRGRNDRPDPMDFRYPYDFVSIPVCQRSRVESPQSKPTADDDGLAEESILLASDAVCRAYGILSEIWNDRTTRSVIILAPPGSGKELLAKSIYLFQHLKGNCVVYALSPSSHERNDRALFARDLHTLFEPDWMNLSAMAEDRLKDAVHERLQGLLDTYTETTSWADKQKEPDGSVEPKTVMSDGLLFKARQGALILDEIDKVLEQTRASLLRLLENDEFALYDTSMVLKLGEWRPLYVFTGSMSRGEMFDLKPRDFWTRISHIVEVQHPLDNDDEEERKRISRNYFAYFWVKHLPGFFIKGKLLPFEYDGSTQPYFENYYLELFTLLNRYENIDSIARIFAEEIESGTGSKEFSIRNIRSVVGRMIYGLVDYLHYQSGELSALSAIRRDILRNGRDNENGIPWFELVGRLLTISGAKERGNGYINDLEQHHGEKFREEIRQIMRSALRKIYI